jgi:hypothetical protein
VLLTLLAPLAIAADLPDDAAVLALVSKAKGKDVPEKFLCTHAPVLPEPFDAPLIVAGVKVKGKGCVTQGVVSRGRLEPAEKALPVVLGTTWPTLDAEAREAAIAFWTKEVLFAYAQPTAAPEVETRDGVVTVTTPILRRSTAALTAEETTVTHTFAADGTATVTETPPTTWVSSLVLKPNSAKGLSVDELQSTLESRGKLLERCLRGAWQEDLTLVQRTRIAWDIAQGKATGLKVRQQHSHALSQCFANVIGQLEFPTDGTVDVEFGVRRVQSAAE